LRPRRRTSGARAFGLALALFLAGCAAEKPQPPELVLENVSFADLPGWHDDDPAAALPALRKSCPKLGAAWKDACAALAQTSDADARGYFERWFQPHRVTDRGKADGLITGYYEPELRGARAPSARYRVPLYRLPDDLVSVDLGQFRASLKGERIAGRVERGRLVPYASRAEIDRGALAGRNLEMLWVDDPVDAFVLQIQGSGRVTLEDGSLVRVGYAGGNGRVYTAIGRELVKDGAMTVEDATMPAIRAWLDAHPAEAEAMMARNESYVFFRALSGDGPVGAQGVVLTPGRSIAVDPKFIPLGAPVFVATVDPLDTSRPLRRLTVAQDTGGAIRGPVRADFFWGHGGDAAERAGTMRGRGALYLLLPKNPDLAPTS
jgi:membrane-bound lytic murein transglycosylase A